MVTRFSEDQVRISAGDNISHITLKANYIGTDGVSALGGGNGVAVVGGDYAVIGGPDSTDRNVISGNDQNISMWSDANFNRIEGNHLGLNHSGTAIITGTYTGVLVSANGPGLGSSGNLIKGNVISGAATSQVDIVGADNNNNVLKGNYIGTNSSGSALAEIIGSGILVNGDGNEIGDTTTGSGNVISGLVKGIWVYSTATGTVIRGNLVGTDKDGAGAIPNSAAGIYLQGPATISRNVISGNTDRGIELVGSSTLGTTITWNRIGVNAAGSAALPNAQAILLFNGASAKIANNWIANHSTHGVFIDAASKVASKSRDNCITANASWGAYNNNVTAPDAPLMNNWWNAITGPTHSENPGGTGDSVTNEIDYTPFLTKAALACSILQNADFETDADSDVKPDGWTYANFVVGTDKHDCSTAKSGACSLKLTGNGTKKTATQTITKSGGDEDLFTFSLLSKADLVPKGSVYRLKVQFYNGGSLLATKTKSFGVGTHGFRKVGGIYTAPGPYTQVVYSIIFEAASGTAWFDAAVLSGPP
jgi:hypothetical protein